MCVEWCAFVVAVVAVLVGVWEGRANRKHNRLSVEPRFSFFTNLTHDPPGMGIHLDNNGLGPGIIREVRYMVDGERVSPSECDPWKTILAKLEIRNHWKVITKTLFPSNPIRSGEQRNLMVLEPAAEKVSSEELMRILGRLRIEIEYESIYGEVRTSIWDHAKRLND